MADTDGQAGDGLQTTGNGPETTAAAPVSQTTGQQTSQSAPVQAEETFFDPESIKDKPELMSAYKQMQGEFTKFAKQRKDFMQKVQAYDAFTSNPAQALQELATQYGFTLTRAQAQQMVNNQTQDQNAQKLEPQSWDEVYKTAEERAIASVMKQLQPFLKNVEDTRKSQLETMLDSSCPDWRVYEDRMTETLKSHPTLVNDPVTLYRLSVPPEVLESRATQAALRKLQDKATAAKASPGSTTNQTATTTKKATSFNEAVANAKAQLEAKGIRAPR